MTRLMSIAALFTLFIPLMMSMMDLFAYRRRVVHPLLSARDPSRVPVQTPFGFWDFHQVLQECAFLKGLTDDAPAQVVASSLRRRLMLIFGLAVPTAILFATILLR